MPLKICDEYTWMISNAVCVWERERERERYKVDVGCT